MSTLPHGPVQTQVPPGSAIAARLPGASYWDCFDIGNPHPETSALQAWLLVADHSPGWSKKLMVLRNSLVRLVGLKAVGQIDDFRHTPQPPRDYRVGDRVGIFYLQHLANHEVVMTQDDRHLDVWVSLFTYQRNGQHRLAVSSVVQVHNGLGRFYMAVITPFHKAIVRATLRRYLAAASHG
jgi:hypothetical protein